MLQQNDKKRILMAMSGGVDSSVAAALLKNQGHEVIGVHLQLWDHGEKNLERFGGRCCSLIDANDARRVCDKIDIPYYVINAQEVFQEEVVDYFVHEYLQNRTPNPCAQCNQKIKFSYLFQKADELGCSYVATGHYAQVVQDPTTQKFCLVKSTDLQKDQSYFLFGLTQKALARTLMPLGGLTKMMVRSLAESYQLLNAQKADSQEICFIGSEGYKKFIDQRVSPALRPGGLIRTVEGEILGEHTGLHGFTIGQRKGLKLATKSSEEFFVVGFDATTRSLIVGPEKYLYHENVVASQVNWITPQQHQQPGHPTGSFTCQAKIRSRHEEATCQVTCFENDRAAVNFLEPQRAITPGQAIVFYQNDQVLGGGYIESTTKLV